MHIICSLKVILSYICKGGAQLKSEAKFQADLKKKIKNRFVGCYIHKTDCNDIQGIPDLMVSFKGYVFYLEVKRSSTAAHRPNQDYHVNRINELGGFARFIFPENEEQILNEMEERVKCSLMTTSL